ncbi:sugar transferase [Fretibacterium sp. OH1220_COT-178]|uniref:sugar transferase n=1 Tax=Fretibacterium sp. OH1220_COT-178 TaxID=2491047 RepID=UPI000F5D9C05|nr:sugar transferase [Fretibacterium sp. OH1220_COT-178]RRD65823.1 sugar transferase [Fretibacterium sp. OH1220_COT-178]
MLKRLVDLTGSFLGLLLLSPVFLLLTLAIRRRMGPPAIFSQLRAGLGGRPFRLYKFRSMTDARDGDGSLLPDADRLTPLGVFLRRSSLDELPQLWNVLCGAMSLVGPRPLLLDYVPLYDERQRKRLSVKPGITGWAQINGRNALTWEEKFELDVWYVEHRTFWLDAKILAITAWKVLRREGISSPGEATMPRFRGS